ncbi:MAG: NUDIX hydrolase [Gammaproteobacteria bacterium]|nr:NUDIX hydrolase [Gammaproteobacteria bacterium]
MPRPLTPPIAADTIIELGDASERSIVLIERRNPPHGWALPGGFMDEGETIEQAAVREAREETGLRVELDALLGVYSRPDRDPRGQTVSVVFVARATGTPRGQDDALRARAFRLQELPSPLAFDHDEILADYARFRATGKVRTPDHDA